jgi:hypothetical protein
MKYARELGIALVRRLPFLLLSQRGMSSGEGMMRGWRTWKMGERGVEIGRQMMIGWAGWHWGAMSKYVSIYWLVC